MQYIATKFGMIGNQRWWRAVVLKFEKLPFCSEILLKLSNET